MDLNHRPVDYRSTALPLSYLGEIGLGPSGTLNRFLSSVLARFPEDRALMTHSSPTEMFQSQAYHARQAKMVAGVRFELTTLCL